MYIYTQNKLNIIGVNERSKFSIDTSQQGLPRLVVYEDGVKHILGVYLPNEAMTVLKQLLQALSEGQASYEMPISSRFSNGYPLSSNDVQRITAKLSVTTHARHRMIERGLFSADVSPEKMKESVILYIRNPLLYHRLRLPRGRLLGQNLRGGICQRLFCIRQTPQGERGESLESGSYLSNKVSNKCSYYCVIIWYIKSRRKE